jgi:hypothetical protein
MFRKIRLAHRPASLTVNEGGTLDAVYGINLVVDAGSGGALTIGHGSAAGMITTPSVGPVAYQNAFLGGKGAIGGNVVNHGILAPGNSGQR